MMPMSKAGNACRGVNLKNVVAENRGTLSQLECLQDAASRLVRWV
jgi:hypothetical protein